MATILVTGGAGYVGSHVLLPLIASGHHPVVVDNLSRGHRDLIPNHPLIEFVKGDITEYSFLQSVLSAYSVDAVMHYAALAYVEESYHCPADYYRTNTSGTLSLLESLVSYRPDSPPPLVVSSSCAVYGNPPDLPIHEESNRLPISPYGRSKLAAEWLIQDMANAHGIQAAILRYFNAAGSDHTNGIGERHTPETHLIPLAIAAARNQDTFSLYGTDHPTPDGSAIRDFIHVDDLATAHLLALNHLLNGGQNLCLNLGSGVGFSVLEVVEAIQRHTGQSIQLEPKPRRIGDPSRLVCDPKRARQLLGWRPVNSDLDRIVADAVAWDVHCHG